MSGYNKPPLGLLLLGAVTIPVWAPILLIYLALRRVIREVKFRFGTWQNIYKEK